jgi:DNA replication protein DnaC
MAEHIGDILDDFGDKPRPDGPAETSTCDRCGVEKTGLWSPFSGTWVHPRFCSTCEQADKDHVDALELNARFTRAYEAADIKKKVRRDAEKLRHKEPDLTQEQWVRLGISDEAAAQRGIDKLTAGELGFEMCIHPILYRWATNRHPRDIENYWGFYLYGPTGTGKSSQAAAAIKLFLRHWITGKGESFSARYIHALDVLEQEKDSFDNEDVDAPDWHAFKTCDLLVIDDIGTERGTKHNGQKIASVINHRYDDFKMTIFTSNLSLSELGPKTNQYTGKVEVRHNTYDARITDRIGEMIGSMIDGNLAEIHLTEKFRTTSGELER